MKFSKDFLFGAASASYQVEGAWNEDGKGVSNWDVFSKIDGKTYQETNGDVAVDHYHRYKEDIALMAEMGLESYRFSISWTRIYPNGDGELNQKGLDFYNNVINECLKYNIIPFVTLYHWDLPQELEINGGWTNERTLKAFQQYADTCFKAFGDRVKHWITFNETVIFSRHGYIFGAHPPGILNDFKNYYQVLHNVFLTHAKVVLNFKDSGYQGDIGITHVFSPAFPADDKESSKKAAEHANMFDTFLYYDPILKGTYPEYVLNQLKEKGYAFELSQEDQEILLKAAPLNDFIGINYYQPMRVIANDSNTSREITRESSTGGAGAVSYDGVYQTVKVPDHSYTKWGWEISPEALLDGMHLLKNEYGNIPIYITENGLGDEDPIVEGEIKDAARIDYIEKHLKFVKKGISEGLNIKGYFAWSVIDLLSWLNGYKKQYGFIYVDHKDHLNRKKKDSFYWYQEVIATRGENL
ncbi:6-phospho-beta-glucosidase [Carnobacterium alterfunditum]|jgi:6-phospho-beta-glucosidase|uniref:beta-glucosidase n=1 Tax=Carnobacterium alterfunditum TaxID=28230 RepID=A0A1N6EL03_9LACT|nr:glycoside hydrolase family 1 protein [Carnobacterium alterfunditum]SIN83769.1 6-phospho-beta-glucosidase [Carnobacterium alterfunditum]